MRFRLGEVAAAVDGDLVGGAAPDLIVDGVGIDSRAVAPGSLFVPIVAGRDGHEFIDAAIAGGAAAHLTARPNSVHPAVRVGDTGPALMGLGARARHRIEGPVVGITGSVGKTSVKDLAVAAMNAGLRTHASPHGYNNELGLPLTLANAPDNSEAVIVEMGARGVGHIAELCAIARPTIAVVTLVAAVHTELFGSIDEVARGKGELVESLDAHGFAVLNADDDRVAGMAAQTGATVITFGAAKGDVRAEHITIDRDLRPRFTIVSPWGRAQVLLPVRGAHNAVNAAAALAAAVVAGVDFHDAVAGLADAELSRWRMEVGRTSSGAVVINDAWNASPTSMMAALDSLAAVTARRRVAVIGLMAELGEGADQEHRAIARRLVDDGLEVIVVGTDAYGIEPVPDIDAALAVLGPVGEGDAVLIKASRVAGLERIAAALLT
ncbi:MAG: UDP-N-acetylmuramoyl-tripeptide--D-alanyl-D-alanine ligase [Actinomycetia bacterium]|nr:UDP-N-acetylmuramoyl-tripeptide--D-alanyl-D-alanine ligase [Actinomycetes bacterium]